MSPIDSRTKLKNLIQGSVMLVEAEKSVWLQMTEKLNNQQVKELTAIFQEAEDRSEQALIRNQQAMQKISAEEKAFLEDFKRRKIPEAYRKSEEIVSQKEEQKEAEILSEIENT